MGEGNNDTKKINLSDIEQLIRTPVETAFLKSWQLFLLMNETESG
jgi:hypothetical protein